MYVMNYVRLELIPTIFLDRPISRATYDSVMSLRSRITFNRVTAVIYLFATKPT